MTVRDDIVGAPKKLKADQLNQGISGRVSVRFGGIGDMQITRSVEGSSVIRSKLTVRLSIALGNGAWRGLNWPLSEPRFHRDILRAGPHLNPVAHTQAPVVTSLATRLTANLEALADQHYHAVSIVGGVVSSAGQSLETATRFEGCGMQSTGDAG